MGADKTATQRAMAGVGKQGEKLVLMLYVIAEGFNEQMQLGFGEEQLLALAGGLYVLANSLRNYLIDNDGGK